MVPDDQKPDEPKDYNFRSYCFEEQEPAKIDLFEKVSTEIVEMQASMHEGVECLTHSCKYVESNSVEINANGKIDLQHIYLQQRKCEEHSRSILCIEITEHEDVKEIMLPIKPKQLQQLQKNDVYCREVAKKLHKDQEIQKILIKEKGILYRLWTEDGCTTIVF